MTDLQNSLIEQDLNKSQLSKQIGENLKRERKNINKRQIDVASILRMPQQQYSRFENGVFELNYEQILKICKF